jgi:hypothetical protein
MSEATILDVAAADYHADNLDIPEPTLSASIAHKLLTLTPAHARAEHPRLNPLYERDDDPKFELGRAVHALLLEGEAAVDVHPFKDWRSGEARAAKAESRSYGRIPMLAAQWDNCRAMVDAIRDQLTDFPASPPLFESGAAEQTIVWTEQGVACRARLDWLHDDQATVDDLKTVGTTPRRWRTRSMFDHGCDLQTALYMRAVKAVTGRIPAWRWCVVETSPPYALEVVRPSAAVLALGDAKVDEALSIWKRCLETDEWPAYPREVIEAELPVYIESAWLEREAREEIAA